MKLRHFRISRALLTLNTKITRHKILVSFVLICIFFTLGAIQAKNYLNRQKINTTDILSFFGSPKESLVSTGGVTNFLIMGMRGEGSDSPDLTDTVMVFSYNHDTKKPSLISIPRDLWIPSLKTKINAVYHYGQQASPSAGIALSQAAVLEITGLPIHYTSLVNFTLFQKIIDLVGGVEVQNPEAFTDSLYPIEGKENAMPISARYETVSFLAGPIHLDGVTALKYVRSRHASGDQGTDFARSNRQKLVINSLLQKYLSPDFLLNQQKVKLLFSLISNNLITNISPSLYPTLAKLALDIKSTPINQIALTDLPDDKGVKILYNPPVSKYYGEWVLVPKDNNYNALKQYIQNKLTNTQ